MTVMTPDERELWNERVTIMLAEFNPAGMTDAEVEAATVRIEAVATGQIMSRREAGKVKKQIGFDFGGAK